ncbi:MAG TPA: tetratricopeptide repeat protein [Bryobacteraceae bacterium]|nr:tetratricopeptide repeat protein [Bryobacteraceae bacterium]
MRAVLGPALVSVLLAQQHDPPDYLAAARLVEQHRSREALERIAELSLKYPGNPKVGNLKGLALADAGNASDAIAAFQAVLRDRPAFAPALKNLAVLEWASGRHKQAAAHTAEALQITPRDPVLNAYAALTALDRRKPDAAARHLEAAGTAIAAMAPDLELRLGVLAGSQGLYARASAVFEDLVRRGYGQPDVRYNLALARFLGADYAGAVRDLEALSANQPSSEALNLLAQSYEKSGQLQKAIDTLRRAISAAPRDENNYLDLANLCMDHGSYSLGIEVVEAGLHVIPRSAKLLFQLGLLHVLSGNSALAQDEFERAGRLEPASALPAAAIELSAIQQSRLAEAAVSLRERIKRNPDSPVLWYLLGSSLIRSGADAGSPEFTEAEAAFRNATKFDPKLPYPYIELGKMYMRMHREREAVPLLEKATALAPAERAPYYQLAIAYRILNRPEQSKQMLAKIRELSRTERETRFAQQNLVKLP